MILVFMAEDNNLDYSLSTDDGTDRILQDTVGKLEQENKVLSSSLTRVEEETALLRELFNNASSELNNLKKPALLVADVVNVMKDKAVIRLPNGNKFYCYVAKELSIQPGDSVLVDQRSLNIVERVQITQNFDVEKFVIIEKPQESWKEIGGLKEEISEVKEVIELPLNKPQLFQKVGIMPPKGVL